MIKIAGAGIAGLTAAINLAKDGKDVEVHEKLSSVGAKIEPNIQILENWSVENILKEIEKMNINLPKINPIKKIILYSPSLHRGAIIGRTKPVGYFVQRGGKGSFEYHLYKLAKKSGVKFFFNSRYPNADIIATGAREVDAYCVGGVFEGVKIEKATAEVFVDYRYCPQGYMYIVPHGKTKSTVIFGTIGKYDLWKYIEKAKKNHPILRDKLKDSKMLHRIYGFMNCGEPKFLRGKSLVVGEAAKLQDRVGGFGMKYAISSGYFAAQSILHKLDYIKLCEESFGKEIRFHLLGKRFWGQISNNIILDKIIRALGTIDVEQLGKLWKSKLELFKLGVSALKEL